MKLHTLITYSSIVILIGYALLLFVSSCASNDVQALDIRACMLNLEDYSQDAYLYCKDEVNNAR